MSGCERKEECEEEGLALNVLLSMTADKQTRRTKRTILYHVLKPLE